MTSPDLKENSSNIEDFSSEIAEAKSLLQTGQFEAAVQITDNILSLSPLHMDALYLRAVAERYAQNFESAAETLSKLKSAAPEYGRAYQEEGHIFLAKGEKNKALQSYQQATQFNPGLEASWKAQSEILESLNRPVEARNARGFYDRIMTLPRQLHIATNFLHEGKLVKAEQVCKRYMLEDQHNVEGMRILADIASRLGANHEAEFLYETALELEPKNISVLIDYVSFLKSIQKPQKALEHAKILNHLLPDNPMLQSILAIQYLQVGDYDIAMGLFDRVLEKVPNDPVTLTSKGHALKTYGEQSEAISCYRKAFMAKPDHGEAYFSLANLKTYKFRDDEVRQMEKMLKSGGLNLQNRASLNFSLGKAYEDKKEFETAFFYYKAGNENKRTLSRYDMNRMTEDLQAQKDACDHEFFLNTPEKGVSSLIPYSFWDFQEQAQH